MMTELKYKKLMDDNERLKEILLKWMPKAGKYATSVDNLFISRYESDTHIENCFYKPSVGVVVQGNKRSVVGAEECNYGKNQCLVVSVDMPSSFFTSGATPEYPFLAISLDLDRHLLSRLVMELPAVPDGKEESCKGVMVTDATPELLNAFLRLAELLEKPEELRLLAPLAIQEIYYRLLLGPLGNNLRRFSTAGTQNNQIALAIEWLRNNYRKPLHVEALAHRVNMGTSTFYRYFKEVTSLSPLQYQKCLRLYEAQRLMLMENVDVASAGLAVGYESPMQFNREYKRMFGKPPRRDVMHRRETKKLTVLSKNTASERPDT